MLWFDTGVFYPSLGLSNSEISSLSRSMHKSQGFGSTGTRGSDKEYVQLLKGTMPSLLITFLRVLIQAGRELREVNLFNQFWKKFKKNLILAIHRKVFLNY